MTEDGTKKKTARARRKKQAEPASRGLTPGQVAAGGPPAKIAALEGRFRRGRADFEEVLDKMLAAARKLDASKIKPGQVAQAYAPPE